MVCMSYFGVPKCLSCRLGFAGFVCSDLCFFVVLVFSCSPYQFLFVCRISFYLPTVTISCSSTIAGLGFRRGGFVYSSPFCFTGGLLLLHLLQPPPPAREAISSSSVLASPFHFVRLFLLHLFLPTLSTLGGCFFFIRPCLPLPLYRRQVLHLLLYRSEWRALLLLLPREGIGLWFRRSRS